VRFLFLNVFTSITLDDLRKDIIKSNFVSITSDILQHRTQNFTFITRHFTQEQVIKANSFHFESLPCETSEILL
jgi:hypothetical protein